MATMAKKTVLSLAVVGALAGALAAGPRAPAQETAADMPTKPAVTPSVAEPPADREAPSGDSQAPSADRQDREQRLRMLLTGVRLVGRFTIDAPAGAEGGERRPPSDEEYVIRSVSKLGDGDWWTVVARMRYGSVDLTLPVPVEVKWAGDTPVITLDKVAVPGLGTFSSRVVIDGGRYAGTWQHDAVGGHMFGRILPVADPAVPQNTDRDAPPR